MTSFSILLNPNVMGHSEEYLMIKAAQGNPSAFEPLYVKYFKPVLHFVQRRIRERDAALDITQQVFMQALASIQGYRDHGHAFSSWLFRIALNEINMQWRRDKAMRIVCIEQFLPSDLGEDVELNSVDDSSLFEAMRSLPPNELLLIELRYFEKRNYREISEIMQSSEANCKNKVYRILQKLQKKLSQ